MLKKLPDRKDKTVAAHGTRLLDTIKELFKTIHERDSMNAVSFSTKLDACSKKIIAVATIDIPDDKDCKNMANRFLKHGDAYFQFITTPGIDPTNISFITMIY